MKETPQFAARNQFRFDGHTRTVREEGHRSLLLRHAGGEGLAGQTKGGMADVVQLLHDRRRFHSRGLSRALRAVPALECFAGDQGRKDFRQLRLRRRLGALHRKNDARRGLRQLQLPEADARAKSARREVSNGAGRRSAAPPLPALRFDQDAHAGNVGGRRDEVLPGKLLLRREAGALRKRCAGPSTRAT